MEKVEKLKETESSYVTELKSLFQDKFFMLLLGISVAIVLLSTVYSAIKPKDGAVMTKNESKEASQSVRPDDGLIADESEGLAGLGDNDTDDAAPTDALRVTTAQISLVPTVVVEAKKTETKGAQTQKVDEKKTVKPSKSEYVVKQGDTLWAIAEANYGSGYNYVDIAAANKLANSDVIDVGQKLMLPGADKKVATVGSITPQATAVSKADQSVKTHTVASGDSLWEISTRYFGNGHEWVRLASENKIPYPDLIYPNQTIRLRN